MRAEPVTRPTRPKLKPHEVVRYLLESYFILREYSAREGRYVMSYQGYDFSYLDLDEYFRTLSDTQRLAVNLHVCNGLDRFKTARVMGIHHKNVDQICEAACKRIAKSYFGS